MLDVFAGKVFEANKKEIGGAELTEQLGLEF